MKSIIKIAAIFLVVGLVSCGGSSEDEAPVVTIKTPGKVSLAAPARGATCEPGANTTPTQSSVVFSWSASTDTDSYDLKITNLNNQETVNQTGITATTATVTLNRGVPYSWVITSKNKGSSTTDSDIWRFYLAGVGVTNYAPFPAAAVSPLPGTVVTPANGKTTLSWETSDVEGGALSYTLFFDTIDGKQTPLDANKNLTTKSKEVSVSPNTIYYWRVTTSDGANTSTSIVYTFKTP